MKRTFKTVAIFLLIFLGFGGVYGAWMLISDPSGGKFDWSPDLLQGTPFKSYLIPGILLMISNGLLPLFVAVITILDKKVAGLLISLQGAVTTGWLSIQIILNPDFFVPATHYPSYAVAGLLLILGFLLLKKSLH